MGIEPIVNPASAIATSGSDPSEVPEVSMALNGRESKRANAVGFDTTSFNVTVSSGSVA